MSSTSNWMSANLFAKTESWAASARCDGSVWTVECVWMSYYACIELFVIFFFFGLLPCMAFTISDGKNTLKSSTNQRTLVFLCVTANSTRGKKRRWMSLIYEGKIRKDFADAIVLTFISPKLNLDPFSISHVSYFCERRLRNCREEGRGLCCMSRKRLRTSASGKSRGWLRKVEPICVKIYRSVLILQTYRTSAAS